METILYALIEGRSENPLNGQPFYIGIGTAKRPYMHIKKARSREGHYNLLMHACLTDHLAEGCVPRVQILGIFQTREEAANAEREVIKRYGRLGRDPGGILCNSAAGGAGPDPELLRDPEIIARLAAASKARWENPEYRAIRSAALKRALEDPELVKRVSLATAAALREPETRAKHLTALRRINAAMTPEQRHAAEAKRSPDSRAKSVAALGAIRNDPVIQAKRAENSREPQKNSWADPEIRARRIAAMRGKKKTMTPEAIAARQANAKKALTPEALEARKEAMTEVWQRPEHRAKRSRNQAAAWNDPEKRANMLAGRSDGIAKSWDDPDVRARRIAGIRAARKPPAQPG